MTTLDIAYHTPYIYPDLGFGERLGTAPVLPRFCLSLFSLIFSLRVEYCRYRRCCLSGYTPLTRG